MADKKNTETSTFILALPEFPLEISDKYERAAAEASPKTTRNNLMIHVLRSHAEQKLAKKP